MRLIIQGDWFDCQVIRDRIFLWDTDGQMVVLDLRQAVYGLKIQYGYKFEYTLHRDLVYKFIISLVRIKGGIYPIDSAYMGNHLYTATEAGLYRRYLQEGNRIAEMPKGLSKKLIGLRFQALSAKTNTMAMAGGSEGLFELYNPLKYRITKSGHKAEEIEKGIYSVNRTFSKAVWYDKQDIISINKEGSHYRSSFTVNKKVDENGKILRNYIRQNLIGAPGMRMLPSPIAYQKDSREVFTLITDNDGVVSYQFVMRSFKNPITIAGKPRKYLFGEFGMAAESKTEQIVVGKKGAVTKIEGPITRSRVVSGFGKKNGLLVVVRRDHVLITDCENDE